MEVPFFDLQEQIFSLRPQLDASYREIVDHGHFIMGPEVEAFERSFADFCGAQHCVSVGSGTAALQLGLQALGIGEGDEVVLPANTYIACAMAVAQIGARPVLVDIDESYHMDREATRAAISSRTKALMPVHLYGQAMDVGWVLELAQQHGLRVIEDACQAHGAMVGSKHVGTFGDLGCFSFYPSKNLGAFGDGGAIITGDEALAQTLRLLRDFGQRRKYEHLIKTGNSRLDTVQAGVLLVKLAHLRRWNDSRRSIAAQYDAGLSAAGIKPPQSAGAERHVYHLYVIELEHRDYAGTWLRERGVKTGVHYPIPIHRQPAFADLGLAEGEFPRTERACARLLSLPMYPELGEERMRHVNAMLKAFAEQQIAGGSKVLAGSS